VSVIFDSPMEYEFSARLGDCGVTKDGFGISFSSGTLAAGEQRRCTYDVRRSASSTRDLDLHLYVPSRPLARVLFGRVLDRGISVRLEGPVREDEEAAVVAVTVSNLGDAVAWSTYAHACILDVPVVESMSSPGCEITVYSGSCGYSPPEPRMRSVLLALRDLGAGEARTCSLRLGWSSGASPRDRIGFRLHPDFNDVVSSRLIPVADPNEGNDAAVLGPIQPIRAVPVRRGALALAPLILAFAGMLAVDRRQRAQHAANP
jgi:hypothetical protein